jgi:hypothetical protein
VSLFLAPLTSTVSVFSDKMALLSEAGSFSDVMFSLVAWEGFLVAGEGFLVAGEGFISFSIFGKLLPYLEGCFSCFMSGWPRSTLDKTSPSKPDNVVVQCILFPEDKCNASI